LRHSQTAHLGHDQIGEDDANIIFEMREQLQALDAISSRQHTIPVCLERRFRDISKCRFVINDQDKLAVAGLRRLGRRDFRKICGRRDGRQIYRKCRAGARLTSYADKPSMVGDDRLNRCQP
jgi:hypothetical protein